MLYPEGSRNRCFEDLGNGWLREKMNGVLARDSFIHPCMPFSVSVCYNGEPFSFALKYETKGQTYERELAREGDDAVFRDLDVSGHAPPRFNSIRHPEYRREIERMQPDEGKRQALLGEFMAESGKNYLGHLYLLADRSYTGAGKQDVEHDFKWFVSGALELHPNEHLVMRFNELVEEVRNYR